MPLGCYLQTQYSAVYSKQVNERKGEVEWEREWREGEGRDSLLYFTFE